MLNDMARKTPTGMRRAMKPGIGLGSFRQAGMNPMIGADLGGAGPQEISKGALGNGTGNVGDWPYNKFARKTKKAAKPHMKPKGKIGKAQVKRLGRTYKTGGFNKIATAAGKKYGSAAAGKRVAGAIFNKMAQAHGHARKSKKSYAHKGHTHMSRKAMKAC